MHRNVTVPLRRRRRRMGLRWGYLPGGEEVVHWVPCTDKNL